MCFRLLHRNTDYAIIIFGISVFTELGRECRGEVIFPPRNKVILEGEEVLMECRTSNSGRIVWTWTKIKNSSTEARSVIFTGTRIVKNYSHIYGFSKTTGGEYDLSMNASMAVAGKYICDEPGGKRFSAELIVLASNPICFVKTQVGFNYTLECDLRLNGNWFPEMEWEEEYYNEAINEPHITIMTANTVASNKLIVSTMTVAGEEFQRNFTCKTKFKSTGLPHSTTAKNIPNYEYKCIVSVGSLQQSSTTAVYTDDYQIPLMIGSVIMCAVLALLIYILCKRKHRALVLKRSKKRNGNAANEDAKDKPTVESISDFASSRNQGDLDIIVEPAASRINYEEISHEDCTIHVSFNKDSPDCTYINAFSGNAAKTEDREYACLQERGHDHQSNTYAALRLHSNYQN